jgi:hypothetical protein
MHIHRSPSAGLLPRSDALSKGDEAKPPTWARRSSSASDAVPLSASGLAPARDAGAALPPELRGKKLGELLRPPFDSKFEALQNRRNDQIASQISRNKLDHLQPGRLLGSGSGKDAYEIPGQNRALLICKPGAPSLAGELLILEQLKSTGMPTAKILDVGTHEGREAMVMPKYEAIFKPAEPGTEAGREFMKSPLVNAHTLRDLEKIRDTIKREEIVVFDLQYGIDKAGHLHVLDPMGVSATGGGLSNQPQLHALDSLLGAMRQRPGR